MFDHPSSNHPFSKSHSSCLNTVALFGQNPIAFHLSRLFSSVGFHVYLFSSSTSDERSSFSHPFTLIKNRNDLPYLSSVLINCQNDLILMKNFINSLPNEYQQRMAYVECSAYLRQEQLELFHQEMKFSFYLCMNLIELETSTMIQPHFHLICSGDEIVYQKLLLQTNLPAKITFLNQTRTPFDSFYLCLLHRYSQAIHLAIYAEMMAVFKAANQRYPGNLQFLFDWSYLKRPIMRQIILQSLSSSFTFTNINDFQLLLECMMDYFEKNFSQENVHHLRLLTHKLHRFVSNFDMKEKDKALFELFTLY